MPVVEVGDGSQRILDLIFKLISGVMLFVLGFVVNFAWKLSDQIQINSNEISMIKANRFTPEDALEFERAVNARLSTLDDSIDKLHADVRVILSQLENGKEGK